MTVISFNLLYTMIFRFQASRTSLFQPIASLLNNMILHSQLSDSELRSKIRKQEIRLGGNKNLKIYGLLKCTSGKRMKKENRVFFADESEALQNGYRPCGHCMRESYKQWKSQHLCWKVEGNFM